MFLSTRTSSIFLFFRWHTDTFLGLATGMVFSAVFGIVFESIHLIEYKVPKLKRHEKSFYNRSNVAIMLARSVLHIFRVLVGYILMLCVMTMNLWILASVVLGCGIGYFLLRPWIYREKLATDRKIKTRTEVTEAIDPLLVKESNM